MASSLPHTDFGGDSGGRARSAAQRGMRMLCWILLVLGVLSAGYFAFAELPALEDSEAVAAGTRGWARLGGLAVGMLLVGYYLAFQIGRLRTKAEVTNAATLMIVLLGLVLVASRLVVHTAMPRFMAWGIADIVALHVAACLTMRWTVKETMVPVVPLLVVWAVTFLVPQASELQVLDRVVVIIISPVGLVPGALIAGWRWRRRKEEHERLVLVDQVELYGGELSRARIVHDAMFPPAFLGHVTFEYEYQPIHEIGGDYVHTYVCPETGRVTLTLLDVAGHGLAAALTVNRLFGELERILAENAAAQPSEITMLLNRYINLTMAPHSMFATGTCMQLDPTSGKLLWVSAGHPPSLVRRMGGAVEDLPTTNMLLGVLPSADFVSNQQEMTLSPGDVVIAYTDGAFEARDLGGDRFGLERVRETARFDPPPRNWPRFIASAVAKHHDGHAEDDVLIAALTLRSLRVPEADSFGGETLTASNA
jgi:serine phosphatase RsbU (regulator of sigma subunit)